MGWGPPDCLSHLLRDDLRLRLICECGHIAEPEDAQYVLERTRGVAGFFGASSIERLAVEPAIEAQARRFKSLRINP